MGEMKNKKNKMFCADHVVPLYPQKLALTSSTSGGRSVGIVRSQTQATEFSFSFLDVLGKIIRLVSVIRQRTRREHRLQQLFVAARTSLENSFLLTKSGYTKKPTDTLFQQFFCCCVYSFLRKYIYRAVA
jgi:hypothetical protein